jgi:hypothetical protein
MPNWTSNTIRAEGDETDLRAFLEAVKWQDQIFDFNRIIPMPELVRHAFHGWRTVEGQDVSAWYQIDPEDISFDEKGARRFTPEEEAALRDIGYSNWYDWSIAKWGTKWNACDPALLAGSAADGFIEIMFDTAWDAPVPVMEKMFEMFPRLSFTCSWRHEGDEVVHGIDHSPNAKGGAL